MKPERALHVPAAQLVHTAEVFAAGTVDMVPAGHLEHVADAGELRKCQRCTESILTNLASSPAQVACDEAPTSTEYLPAIDTQGAAGRVGGGCRRGSSSAEYVAPRSRRRIGKTAHAGANTAEAPKPREVYSIVPCRPHHPSR